MNNDLTQSRLKELFHYAPETGMFTRLITTGKNAKAGDVVFSLTDRYLTAKIDGKVYRLHRVAFLYMTGAFPKEQADHINGDKHDNRWHNLREATHAENCMNKRMQANNTSGFKGVCWDKKSAKWLAQCRLNKKHYYLGVYETPELASVAYQAFAKKNYGKFYRHIDYEAKRGE